MSLILCITKQAWGKLFKSWTMSVSDEMEEKQGYCKRDAAEQVYQNIRLIVEKIETSPTQSDKVITPDNILHKWWYNCRYDIRPIEEPSDSIRQEPEHDLFQMRAYSFDLGETKQGVSEVRFMQ